MTTTAKHQILIVGGGPVGSLGTTPHGLPGT